MDNARMLDIGDMSRDELMETIRLLGSIKDNTNMFKNDCAGRTLFTLFAEENRNSQSALAAAMSRLSGFASSFSFLDGESLKDTVLTACSRCDIIALSHPLKGAALAASLYSSVPVINAGDCSSALPCEALRDISTVWYTKKHVSNMKIGFCGSCYDSGEARALVKCLSVYNGNCFYFCDSSGSDLPPDIKSILNANDKTCFVVNELADMIEEIDVLYMTRVGRESFSSEEEYKKALHRCTLDERLMMAAKRDLAIMHPFPRGEELPTYVDYDGRAQYYNQLEYGVYADMTLIFKLFKGRAGRAVKPAPVRSTHGYFCGHPDCITSTESYLPNLFIESGEDLVCSYCKNKVEK